MRLPDYGRILSGLYGLANLTWYSWKRMNWIIDPRRFLTFSSGVDIERPIFFIGNQGDGLTLVSRMIRRHPDVVSISGDYRYWSGADELQIVMRHRLPKSLALTKSKRRMSEAYDRLPPPHSWTYASDILYDHYRQRAEDYDEETARLLRGIIREALYRYGHGRIGLRFIDKSQTFTLKVGFINELLKDTDPYFVLITRNPYASCYRAAIGRASDLDRYRQIMDLNDRMELAIQHWANAMEAAMEDGERVRHFKVMQFESFLQSPEQSIAKLAEFLDLYFDKRMVPAEDQKLPFGSRYRDRWYPLRSNVNKRYLKEIPEEYINKIKRRCGHLAAELGYEPPY